MRLQQWIPVGGRRSIDGIFEVFNLFDYATSARSPTTSIVRWASLCKTRT